MAFYLGGVQVSATQGINGITVQEDGTTLSTSATTLNFVGTGATASGTSSTKTITIAGNPSTVLNGVGSYAFCRMISSSASPNGTVAGSTLRWSNIAPTDTPISSPPFFNPSGTWRAMGNAAQGGSQGIHRTTLWLRIS